MKELNTEAPELNTTKVGIYSEGLDSTQMKLGGATSDLVDVTKMTSTEFHHILWLNGLNYGLLLEPRVGEVKKAERPALEFITPENMPPTGVVADDKPFIRAEVYNT